MMVNKIRHNSQQGKNINIDYNSKQDHESLEKRNYGYTSVPSSSPTPGRNQYHKALFAVILSLILCTTFYKNDFEGLQTTSAVPKTKTIRNNNHTPTHSNTSLEILSKSTTRTNTTKKLVSSLKRSEKTTIITNNNQSKDTLVPVRQPTNKTSQSSKDLNNTKTKIITRATKNNPSMDKNVLSAIHHTQQARYSNGSYGYIADPTSCKRGRQHFLQQYHQKQKSSYSSSATTSGNHHHDYWTVLEMYESHLRQENYTAESPLQQQSPQFLLTNDYICAAGPGRGPEKDGGYKMLVEKIQIHQQNKDEIIMNNNTIVSVTHKTNKTTSDRKKGSPVKILCVVYTYPRMRDMLRTSALSWGYKCDGFLAFSTETIPSIGLVDLPHEGEETYGNMWQKTRSILAYIGRNYLSDYDFFHVGGDDMYIIVENLRRFLQEKKNGGNSKTPMFWGQWYRPGPDNWIAACGGSGYTLNQAALSLVMTDILPKCSVNQVAAAEDKILSRCFRDLGVTPEDTRDPVTGEQTYHSTTPDNLYTSKPVAGNRGNFQNKVMHFWGTLPHPMNTSKHVGSELEQQDEQFTTVPIGPKMGLEAAAKFSIAFHKLYPPNIMARVHALLYKTTCPGTSPLGRALRIHATLT